MSQSTPDPEAPRRWDDMTFDDALSGTKPVGDVVPPQTELGTVVQRASTLAQQAAVMDAEAERQRIAIVLSEREAERLRARAERLRERAERAAARDAERAAEAEAIEEMREGNSGKPGGKSDPASPRR